MNKHYVITRSMADGIENTITVESVHHTEEAAKVSFIKVVEKWRIIANALGYEIIDDSDTCFNAAECGNYDAQHIMIFIADVTNEE